MVSKNKIVQEEPDDSSREQILDSWAGYEFDNKKEKFSRD